MPEHLPVDVKEAVKIAIAYVADLFGDEAPKNIGLEEVYLDDASDEWHVTVGFHRPWDYPQQPVNMLAQLYSPKPTSRTYKVVRIRDDDGHVVGVKARILPQAES